MIKSSSTSVKGMHLVRELEQDLKVANVICMNGRRHITSSLNEVSQDLVVTSKAKKKQALLDLVPILTELRHATEMQMSLERHVEEGNYFKAFQVLSEYLQVLDSLSELSAVQEMSCNVEVWLAKTLQKLDSLLVGVCQDFKEKNYITVVDAYALIGDITGLAEKIQGLLHMQKSRTYRDLCLQIPESKFRECLLRTLGSMYKLMCSYYSIMGFQPEEMDSECRTSNTKPNCGAITGSPKVVSHIDSISKVLSNSGSENGFLLQSAERMPPISTSVIESETNNDPATIEAMS